MIKNPQKYRSLPFYIWKQLLNTVTLFRVLCSNSNVHIVTVFPLSPLNNLSNLTMEWDIGFLPLVLLRPSIQFDNWVGHRFTFFHQFCLE